MKCDHCGKEMSARDLEANLEHINGKYETDRICIACEWCEFPDGQRFHFREFGPRPGEVAWQVCGAGLRHVAECTSREAAEFVCAALNAVPADLLPVPQP